ncbi:hypothetical protein CRENBAI_014540 [Crenichthys baileyi]|uniref:Uncharacterized protein n=1 Tax=Crenichthys baileyi TaxID=28760 RepID=A0AAV9R1Y8_9TELE
MVDFPFVRLWIDAREALLSLKTLRSAGRFVGKEDTVPLRLVYGNHSQITHDELSTRVKASAGSTQNLFILPHGFDTSTTTYEQCPLVLISLVSRAAVAPTLSAVAEHPS